MLTVPRITVAPVEPVEPVKATKFSIIWITGNRPNRITGKRANLFIRVLHRPRLPDDRHLNLTGKS
jgi:hypothetical protein